MVGQAAPAGQVCSDAHDEVAGARADLAVGLQAQHRQARSASQAGAAGGNSGRTSWDMTPNMICTLLSCS